MNEMILPNLSNLTILSIPKNFNREESRKLKMTLVTSKGTDAKISIMNLPLMT